MDTYDSDDTHEEPEHPSEPPRVPEDEKVSDYDPTDQNFTTPDEPAYEEVAPPAYPPPLPLDPPPVQPRTTYSYEQPIAQEYLQAPLERINPWIGIITQPRATIRYVLDSGEWNNVWLLYALIMLMSLPATVLSIFVELQKNQTMMPQGFEGLGIMGLIVGLMVLFTLVGYPFSMLMLYITGWLYKIVGELLGGVGTSSDLRIALTWAYVISIYMNLILIIPYGIVAILHSTIDTSSAGLQILLALIPGLVSLPLIIYLLVVLCKCVGEAHRFSAWRGLGTMLIITALWIGLFLMLILGIFALIFFVGVMASM